MWEGIEILGMLGHSPLGRWHGWPPWRHTYVPSCQIWSLLVKRYKRTYGNRCKDL